MALYVGITNENGPNSIPVKKKNRVISECNIDRRLVGSGAQYCATKSIILLIREAKTLDPFLRKLRGRRSVKYGTVIDYIEEKCRMLIFFLNNA